MGAFQVLLSLTKQLLCEEGQGGEAGCALLVLICSGGSPRAIHVGSCWVRCRSHWAVPGGCDPSADNTRAMPDTAAVSSARNTVALFLQTPLETALTESNKREEKKNIPTETTASELVP